MFCAAETSTVAMATRLSISPRNMVMRCVSRRKVSGTVLSVISRDEVMSETVEATMN
jgi:hypothetical protein